MSARKNKRILFIAATAAMLSPAQAIADSAGFLADHGIAIYYAVIPARDHPRA